MLEGKTSDSLAIANTAILMRLVEELISSGVITKPTASTVLRDAVDSLLNCPSGEHSNFVDAVTIIRKELMPRIAGPV
ncbi:MAG TPA: hypothetical protein VHK26_09280 [Methyloceanibacter sp.]|jgi:hypothetical protein|nr:hypothetical protein [Methyloceanibacter sp.]